jgi:hypothetical protein
VKPVLPATSRRLCALDDGGSGLLIGSDHLSQIFRIELAGEGRRVDEVTEHHRELTPFGVWGATFNLEEFCLCGLVCAGRRLCGRLSHPDQDSAVLVARQLLGLDEFDLEVFKIGVV